MTRAGHVAHATVEILDAEHARDLPRWQLPDVGHPDSSSGCGEAACTAGESPPENDGALSPLTAERLERIEAQAREQGYQRGLEEGRRAAVLEREQQAETLAALLGDIERPLADLDDELAEEIAGLATAIARQLVRREISADPGQIVGVVRDALTLLPSSERRITLHLHPQDARLVRELLHLDELERPWRILEEPTITRGGLRLITEHTEVDATLETRLGAVVAAVMGDARASLDLHATEAGGAGRIGADDAGKGETDGSIA